MKKKILSLITLFFLAIMYQNCGNQEFSYENQASQQTQGALGLDLSDLSQLKKVVSKTYLAEAPRDNRQHKMVLFIDTSESMASVRDKVLNGLQNMVSSDQLKGKNVKFYIYNNNSVFSHPQNLGMYTTNVEGTNQKPELPKGTMAEISDDVEYVLAGGQTLKAKWGEVKEFESLKYKMHIKKDFSAQMGIPLELKANATAADLNQLRQDMSRLLNAIQFNSSGAEESGICSVARVLNDRGPNAIIKKGDPVALFLLSDENDGMAVDFDSGSGSNRADAMECFLEGGWEKEIADRSSCKINLAANQQSDPSKGHCPVQYAQNTNSEVQAFNDKVSATNYTIWVSAVETQLVVDAKIIDESIQNKVLIRGRNTFEGELTILPERACATDDLDFAKTQLSGDKPASYVQVSSCKKVQVLTRAAIHSLVSDLKKPVAQDPVIRQKVEYSIRQNHCEKDVPFFLTTNNMAKRNFHLEVKEYSSLWDLAAARMVPGITGAEKVRLARAIKARKRGCSKTQMDVEGLAATRFTMKHVYHSLREKRKNGTFKNRRGGDSGGILGSGGFLTDTFAKHGAENITAVSVGRESSLDQGLCPSELRKENYEEGDLNRRFVSELGGRGSWGSLCEKTYGSLLSPIAQSIVDAALHNYIPEGFESSKHQIVGVELNGRNLSRSSGEFKIQDQLVIIKRGLVSEGDKVTVSYAEK